MSRSEANKKRLPENSDDNWERMERAPKNNLAKSRREPCSRVGDGSFAGGKNDKDITASAAKWPGAERDRCKQLRIPAGFSGPGNHAGCYGSVRLGAHKPG
jgi:hypothetical protein